MASKLIIVEGLPGSGKSSTAQFIALQLKRNNIDSEWYYEVGLDHPVDFCYEACLSEEDYIKFLDKYVDYKRILELEVKNIDNRYFYEYIKLERKYKNELPSSLIEYLEEFDINNIDAMFYTELKLKKWKSFLKIAKESNVVTVIESSLLQGPTVEMLLRDEGINKIKSLINELKEMVKELNPRLIYFYQKDIDSSIKKMFEFRGEGFTDYVINMIKDNHYGKSRNVEGLEGAIEFFKDYRMITDGLYNEFDITKLAIENSDGNWNEYNEKIINFLDIKYKEDYHIPNKLLESYVGEYSNEKIGRNLSIKLEDEGLFFYVNETYKEKLIPINNNSFNVRGGTLDLIFLKNEDLNINRFIISGRETGATYGENGLVFYKKNS